MSTDRRLINMVLISAATPEFGPLYQKGMLEVTKLSDGTDLQNCQVGVQVASDGRVWICVDGQAFLRFKPARPHKDYGPMGPVVKFPTETGQDMGHNIGAAAEMFPQHQKGRSP